MVIVALNSIINSDEQNFFQLVGDFKALLKKLHLEPLSERMEQLSDQVPEQTLINGWNILTELSKESQFPRPTLYVATEEETTTLCMNWNPNITLIIDTNSFQLLSYNSITKSLNYDQVWEDTSNTISSRVVAELLTLSN